MPRFIRKFSARPLSPVATMKVHLQLGVPQTMFANGTTKVHHSCECPKQHPPLPPTHTHTAHARASPPHRRRPPHLRPRLPAPAPVRSTLSPAPPPLHAVASASPLSPAPPHHRGRLLPSTTAACRSRSPLARSRAELPIHTHRPEACISPAGDGRATCSHPCGFPGLDLAPETKTTEGSATTSSTDSATCPLYLYGQGRGLLQVRERN
ncbi:early nodulin-like protein 1 [Miscanthus floridulus]|uniref:early nodulin-like protein 1 n=1 Tax=Miscanthus floridulus TaxID=154761 RepID=UPI0034590E2B